MWAMTTTAMTMMTMMHDDDDDDLVDEDDANDNDDAESDTPWRQIMAATMTVAMMMATVMLAAVTRSIMKDMLQHVFPKLLGPSGFEGLPGQAALDIPSPAINKQPTCKFSNPEACSMRSTRHG